MSSKAEQLAQINRDPKSPIHRKCILFSCRKSSAPLQLCRSCRRALNSMHVAAICDLNLLEQSVARKVGARERRTKSLRKVTAEFVSCNSGLCNVTQLIQQTSRKQRSSICRDFSDVFEGIACGSARKWQTSRVGAIGDRRARGSQARQSAG